ncbi:MAG: hypothetical protein K1X91_15520 [Bacteriodetes bacterium]|nr:hypothetical protein [Bacteroidota bacterium]
MKLRTFCCSAVLFCIAHTLAFAQSITLDSLWGKFVGNINAMVFTPDSRSILIGNDEKQLVRYNALTGDTISIIPTLYGAQECIFTKEGNKLFIRGFKGIEIKDASTFQTLDSLPVPTKEHDFASFDINNDGSIIAVKSHVWDSKEVFYWEIAVYNNSTKQTVWSVKTKGALGTNSRYPEGKIALTPDGNYVLGQNSFFLCKWNWRDSIQPGEILIENIPNLELISFSPDRNYFVLKSNYIYSIDQKKCINKDIPNFIEGSTSDYGIGCAFTNSSNTIIVTNNRVPFIIDINSLKVLKRTNFAYTGRISLSHDSNFIAFQLGSDGLHVHNLSWITTNVADDSKPTATLTVLPLPSTEQLSVIVHCFTSNNDCSIIVYNDRGEVIQKVFSGVILDGDTTFNISTSELSSSHYNVVLKINATSISKPFIITK